MDCFYCQVESTRDETLRDIPMAVVQYNPYDCKKISASENRKNIGLGSIIAVNYEARAKGNCYHHHHYHYHYYHYHHHHHHHYHHHYHHYHHYHHHHHHHL